MPFTEYQLGDWLQELEQRYSQEIQLGLDRVRQVAEAMGLLTTKAKLILVAGTNGKGSTVACLEAIYQQGGYAVASYTSPHLLDFNERIRINGQPISDQALCQAFCQVEEARGEVLLSYFEMTTLAALYCYSKIDLDLMILEVGLGGRLDATNILSADLAIITGIDYDHQEWLGESLEAIGYEKAGILRQGIPLIYADNHSPSSIINQARDLACPGYYLGQTYGLSEQDDCYQLDCANLQLEMRIPKTPVQPKAQAAAVMATALLQADLPLDAKALPAALKRVRIPGRQEHIPGPVELLYDVAHNAQSVRSLALRLGQIKQGKSPRLHAVFSALQDKDLAALLAPLKELVDHWYPCVLNCKRAASEAAIAEAFENVLKYKTICYASPLQAFEQASQAAKVGDWILVYGSFYTVAELKLVERNKQESLV